MTHSSPPPRTVVSILTVSSSSKSMSLHVMYIAMASRLWFELMHDARTCKIRAGSDLQNDVRQGKFTANLSMWGSLTPITSCSMDYLCPTKVQLDVFLGTSIYTFSKAARKVDICVLRGPSSSSCVVDCACIHASTSSRKGCCHWRPVFGAATPLRRRGEGEGEGEGEG